MRNLTTKLLLSTGLINIIQYKINHLINSDDYYCYTEAYQNGREHGLSLVVGGHEGSVSVTISESKSSDSIVVYRNNNANQGLSEDSYESATYFDKANIEEVIEFCLRHFTSYCK